eukprot:9155831-Alexandrium_andersonii.AAC.1
MSASLVGSEMCIRDSDGAPCGGLFRLWAAVLGRLRARHLAGPAGEAHSVSYTHLTLPTICSV